MTRRPIAPALAALFIGAAVPPLLRSESTIAGLSTDFWAGFALSCALGLAIWGVTIMMAGNDEVRPAGKDAGMTGGRKRG